MAKKKRKSSKKRRTVDSVDDLQEGDIVSNGTFTYYMLEPNSAIVLKHGKYTDSLGTSVHEDDLPYMFKDYTGWEVVTFEECFERKLIHKNAFDKKLIKLLLPQDTRYARLALEQEQKKWQSKIKAAKTTIKNAQSRLVEIDAEFGKLV